MAKNKRVSIVVLIIVAAAAAVLAGYYIYAGFQGGSGYPDLTKTVYISSTYSNLKVDVTLSPDHTCEYKISSDNYPYKGQWNVSKESKALEIDVNLAHENAQGDPSIVKGTILLYDSKGGKSLAAVPFDAMGMQGGRIYGKWKQ